MTSATCTGVGPPARQLLWRLVVVVVVAVVLLLLPPPHRSSRNYYSSTHLRDSSDDDDDADGADDDAWLNTFATACAGAASQEAVVRRNLGTLDALGSGTIKTMLVATFAPCKQLVQNLPDGVVDEDVKQAVDKLDGLLLRVARGVQKRKQSSLLGHFHKVVRPTEELVGGGGNK